MQTQTSLAESPPRKPRVSSAGLERLRQGAAKSRAKQKEIRAQRAAELLLNGVRATDALRQAGYAESTARRGMQRVATSPSIQAALAEAPLALKTVDQVVNGYVVDREQPPDVRLRAGDMAYKRLGAYVTVNVNANLPDGLDSVRSLVADRLADVLAARMNTPNTCVDVSTSQNDTTSDNTHYGNTGSTCDTSQPELATSQNENASETTSSTGGGAPKPMAGEGDQAP